jgi:hypothetical protein
LTHRIIDLILVTCSISVAWFALIAAAHQVLGRPVPLKLVREALIMLIFLVGSGTIGGYIVATWRYSG